MLGPHNGVGLGAGSRVKVDPTHDRNGAPNELDRRVPFVVAGIPGDVGLGHSLPGLLQLFRRRIVPQGLRGIHDVPARRGHLTFSHFAIKAKPFHCFDELPVPFDRGG